jgi:hypothetical protein
MNIQAIEELADFIEKSDLPFHMICSNKAECGTPGCIGGFAAALWPEVQDDNGISWDKHKLAAKLGVPWEKEEELCFPRGPQSWIYMEATKQDAARVLRAWIETGEIDWSKP